MVFEGVANAISYVGDGVMYLFNGIQDLIAIGYVLFLVASFFGLQYVIIRIYIELFKGIKQITPVLRGWFDVGKDRLSHLLDEK